MSVVVDASAMVEIVQSSPTGRAVASRLVGEAVAAPDVIDVEVASAIRRQQRAGRMDEDEVSRALDLLLDSRWPWLGRPACSRATAASPGRPPSASRWRTSG